MMRSAADQPVVDDGVDKEKKKKSRRSNRRSNRNSSGLASTSGNEIHGETTQTLKDGNKKSFVSSSSSRQQGLDLHPSNVQESTKASDVAFNSMPTMHINELDLVEASSMHHQLPADLRGKIVSMSCPTPSICDSWEHVNEECYAQCPIFLPHLSREAVNEALEKGYALKALFRVNAHNRFEGYCKIDGVHTDVLISGIVPQNRAVEGDVVLVKVDPLWRWPKMKGLANSLSLAEDGNFLSEANEIHGDTYKGKNKVDLGYDHVNSNCTMLPEEFPYEDGSTPGESSYLQSIEPTCCNYVHGHHLTSSDSTYIGSSSQQCDGLDAVERLSATISLNPLKRPTGTVLAIIEGSPRRDCIVGYLNVNKWVNYRDGCKKKRPKKGLFTSEQEYIQLTPSDPKFPKMMVLIKGLPDCIKKRLEENDATLEMELVAAQILYWGEESFFPQAHVLHVFGRVGEVEPHIDAILYENAFYRSEFSPESLSCLPSVPWEVPPEEINSRKDLRNLCIFTIDPSTATDLDDALSIERSSDGIFRVGVHVADVSYFVLPDTPLDMEAQLRSTSLYIFQRKIPMLPFLLSEDLGSLNPGVDRLAFSIFWDLNTSGNVVNRWIGRTVIRSCCKLSYENAQDIIDGKVDAGSLKTSGNGFPQLYGHFEWADVIRSILCLHEVSKTLKEKRFSAGALRLESSKPVLLFYEDGTPYDSVLSERNDSNFLVEEFMLLANVTAAEVICRAFPESALLRKHPAPNIRKLKEFEAFCQKYGLELDTSSSGQFHQSLERVREKLKDDSVLFSILTNYAARPMQLASYFCSGDFKDNVDWSHYGLGVPLYTHFTSPLRRYPDIVVHRTLAAALDTEEYLWNRKRKLLKEKQRDEMKGQFLTGIYYDKDAVESAEGREALSDAALRHGVPCTGVLSNVAAHCNNRKLASRYVKDAGEKLYMWVLLRKKEVLLSEARVLGLGPRFMSIYIHKLAIERRIYYDEVEGLKVEWLEATSTLVLNLCIYKRSFRRSSFANYRHLEDVALVVRPCDLEEEQSMSAGSASESIATNVAAADFTCPYLDPMSKRGVDPGVFPLTVRLLSTIPVALYAVGGDDGPLDVGVRLYMSAYLR